MKAKLATTIAAAALMATPALAAQNGMGQNDMSQNDTTGNGQATMQQSGKQDMHAHGQKGRNRLSEASQQCLDRLQQVDQQLVKYGYGRVGPLGYAPYGNAYAQPAAPTTSTARPTTARTGMLGSRPMGTPRTDMQTLLRAGYIMAINDHPDGCQAVAATARQIGEDYKKSLANGEMTDKQLRDWRSNYLASAVSVETLKQPLTVDEITDADVRNTRDKDLGSVDDVVFGGNGKVRYVVVGTGGFLGIGDEEIAVPWKDLKVTPSPYRDTLVLDVSEQAFDNAPSLQRANRAELADGEHQEIDAYWDEHLKTSDNG